MRKLILILACGALLLAGQSLSKRRAPSFSLPDANQVQHDILDYRGKWLVMTYTTSMNCPQCPPFAKALEQVKNKVAILNVLLSPPENANTATRFATDNKLTTPIVFDQSQTAIAYFKATPTNARIDTPHAFIIDPNGMIADDWPEGRIATILGSKGGVAAALQAVMSAAK